MWRVECSLCTSTLPSHRGSRVEYRRTPSSRHEIVDIVKTYLGVDVGTSATRVALVNDEGSIIDAATSSYGSNRGAGAIVEQDPSAWTHALRDALASLGELAHHPPEAIGLCGQTPTVVPVDSHGVPTRDALTWQDGRASAEARELEERFGDPLDLVGTSLPWSAANMPAKLLWLSRHEPLTSSRTHTILQPKDFIGFALTGSMLSDPWSSKGLCRVTDGEPLGDVLDACGWSTRVCPPCAAPWTLRGPVQAAASEFFGLRSGTPVAVGASDALAQMIAAGSFARSSAFVFSGTSSIVGTTVDDDRLHVAGLFNVPNSCAPLPILYGPTNSGGAALLWASTLLSCDVNGLLELAATAGTSWPTFVPYLSGERAPLWDLDVRALFVGVDERHGRAEIAKSVVTGVFLASRHVLTLIEDATERRVDEVEVVSRGVDNPAWESLALNTLGLNLRFHDDADMSARGAAMLALALDGTPVIAASRQLSAPSRGVSPTNGDVEAARRLLAEYRGASALSVDWSRR